MNLILTGIDDSPSSTPFAWLPSLRDRLTEHLDGLVEAGFVDGTLSEARHDEDDPKVGVCLPDCPVAIAKQQAYLATAYRDHPGQLSLFSP